MIKLAWDPIASHADIVSEGGLIQVDEGFETAVLISLFTDARAPNDADLRGMSKDKRGWWGDTFAQVPGSLMGSRLWLRRRSGITAQLLTTIQQDTRDALQWLVDDGVASAVNVAVERLQIDGGLRISVEISRPDGAATRWARSWEVYTRGV